MTDDPVASPPGRSLLTESQWRVLDALARGERVWIMPATRIWLARHGMIALKPRAARRHSSDVEITELGRHAVEHTPKPPPPRIR